MSEQTVIIGSVDYVKDGTSKNGRKWNLYKVKDGNGNLLGSCFDDIANAAKPLIGKRAVIVNQDEPGNDGQSYLNLKSVEPAPVETTSNGDVDWDAKELRGHRRASVAIAASFYSTTMERPQPENDVFALAQRIVAFVYGSPPAVKESVGAGFPAPPSGWIPSDEDIPF